MLTYTTFIHKTINVQRIKPYKCLKEIKRQAGISACCLLLRSLPIQVHLPDLPHAEARMCHQDSEE